MEIDAAFAAADYAEPEMTVDGGMARSAACVVRRGGVRLSGTLLLQSEYLRLHHQSLKHSNSRFSRY